MTKSLRLHFSSAGFDFRQIERRGDVALFEKRRSNHLHPTFEVVVVQVHPAKTIMGRHYPEREAMPPSESWGGSGWSLTDRVSARRKFNQVAQERGFPPTPFSVDAFSNGHPVKGAPP